MYTRSTARSLCAVLVVFGGLIVASSSAGLACRAEKAPGSQYVKHEITAAELKKKIEQDGIWGGYERGKIIILDVRSDLGEEMIKGALHASSARLDEWVEGTGRLYAFPDKRTTLVVTYCNCAHDEAAEKATEKLRELGFGQVYTLKGGLDAAKAAGIEIVRSPA